MDLVFQLLSVVLVLGLVWGISWFLRKRTPGFSGGNTIHGLSRKARIQLTPHHSVHLIQFRDHEILIGVHPGGYSVLRETK